MKLKKIVDFLIRKLPYVGKWRQVFLKHSTPGNYDSPIPDTDLLIKNYSEYRSQKIDLNNININNKHQLELFMELEKYFNNFNFPSLAQATHRYYSNNIYFNLTDAVILFSMILLKKPAKIIEIGSGYSSALILDVNERYFDNMIDLIFVEPHPERLISLIKKEEKYSLLKNEVQFVNIEIFRELQSNDILFIDSSHITKAHSDVNHLLFNVLPALNKGVLIHFHDIYKDFEYPLEILQQGYYWNESYILRAFLMNNREYSIDLLNAGLYKMLSEKYYKFIREYFLIKQTKIFTGSLWLTKI